MNFIYFMYLIKYVNENRCYALVGVITRRIWNDVYNIKDPIEKLCCQVSPLLTWISNHMSNEMWDDITYPFPNFNCWSFGISNFTPHCIMDVIAHPGWSIGFIMIDASILPWWHHGMEMFFSALLAHCEGNPPWSPLKGPRIQRFVFSLVFAILLNKQPSTNNCALSWRSCDIFVWTYP